MEEGAESPWDSPGLREGHFQVRSPLSSSFFVPELTAFVRGTRSAGELPTRNHQHQYHAEHQGIGQHQAPSACQEPGDLRRHRRASSQGAASLGWKSLETGTLGRLEGGSAEWCPHRLNGKESRSPDGQKQAPGAAEAARGPPSYYNAAAPRTPCRCRSSDAVQQKPVAVQEVQRQSSQARRQGKTEVDVRRGGAF